MKPCPKCPFRTDIPAYITQGRAREIAAALRGGGSFDCHETLDYSGDGDEARPTNKTRFCSGALIVMEHEGGAERNQMVRIHERIGGLDLSKLDLDAPVAKSFRAWIARHKNR